MQPKAAASQGWKNNPGCVTAEEDRDGEQWKAHLVGRECYVFIRIIERKDCWNLSCSKQVSVVVQNTVRAGQELS